MKQVKTMQDLALSLGIATGLTSAYLEKLRRKQEIDETVGDDMRDVQMIFEKLLQCAQYFYQEDEQK